MPEQKKQHALTKVWGGRVFRVWGGRVFRFNIRNFRLSGGLTSRRFSIVEAALLLMIGILASRGLGVIRQGLFNAFFGTGPEANAFYAAIRLPDALFNLIAGGALSHAFIPVFLAYEKRKGQEAAWKLSSLVFNVMLLVLTLVVIGGEFFVPTFTRSLLVPGYSEAEKVLTISLTRILLFQPLLLCLGTIVTGVLNSKRQFLLPAFSIAIYNLGQIAGLACTRFIPGIGIYGPTYGVLVASFLQVAVQAIPLFRQGVRYSFTWNFRHPGLVEVLRLLGPNSLALAVAYLALIIETYFVSFLPDSASLAALHNADMLQALPFSLLSQAIGQALLPHMTIHAAAGRYVRMRYMALRVMGASILLTLPAAIGLAVTGQWIIRLIFQHGAFDAHSTALTYLALLGYVFAIPGVTAGDMISRGFLALKDATTPLFTGILSLLCRVGTIIVLIGVLPRAYVILAIPLGYALGSSVEAFTLASLLLWRLGKKARLDAGMQRLLRYRRYLARTRQEVLASPSSSL
ncbi:murein biosynthesis integral membrane protein MurJ [Ktedonobacter racemifer]|uniref:Probable lipid II flippase MurJ n=1 Tax=Ktedonobacter racemifer DSM 44963 TaxID=485913 RepID=D6TLL6_KTERA|nr:murein biosynthesis integral membrane protein MurJ [Ktedonobacter racemifer]EFH86666.1 virulence factor MVIN family protein [Ktedonobacter racemifer DSM 44963]